MKCPTCGSENTQRLAMIYEQGTTSVHTYSHTSNASASGKSQTIEAQRAAPPSRATWGVIGRIAGVIGILLFSAWSFVHFVANSGPHYSFEGPPTNASPLLYAGIVCVAIFLWDVRKTNRYNETEWKRQYEAWRNRWLCHKCGTVYE